MHFPITIATVPFRIPNSDKQPKIAYGEYKDFLSLNLKPFKLILYLCCRGGQRTRRRRFIHWIRILIRSSLRRIKPTARRQRNGRAIQTCLCNSGQAVVKCYRDNLYDFGLKNFVTV